MHVLVTTQGTGGGGTEYTLKFIGLGRFPRHRQLADLHRAARRRRPTNGGSGLACDAQARPGRATSPNTPVGLAADAALRPARRRRVPRPQAQRSRGTSGSSASAATAASRASRPANHGVPSRGSVSANRTTAEWKVEPQRLRQLPAAALRARRRRGRLHGDPKVVFERGRALIAKSLHRATGQPAATAAIGAFDVHQLRLWRTRLAPTIEYDTIPYKRIHAPHPDAALQRRAAGRPTTRKKPLYEKMSSRSLLDHQFEVSLGPAPAMGSRPNGGLEIASDPEPPRSSTAQRLLEAWTCGWFKGFSVGLRRVDPRGDATSCRCACGEATKRGDPRPPARTGDRLRLRLRLRHQLLSSDRSSTAWSTRGSCNAGGF